MFSDNSILKVGTPIGSFFALFPANQENCVLKGSALEAQDYFLDNLCKMCSEDGHLINLESIDPEVFLTYCNRPDLKLSVSDNVSEDEYYQDLIV